MRYRFNTLLALSFKYYFELFYIVLGFGLALIALLNTLYDLNFSMYFGNLTYSFLTAFSFVYIIPTIVLTAFINSLFLTLLIFIVRKKLLQEYRKVYVLEFIKKHATYVFLFNLILYFVLFFIYLIFANTVVAFLTPIFDTIILILSFYAVQSIVIDEKNLITGMIYGFTFLKKNLLKTLFVILVLTLLFFVIALITLYFQFGFIVSLVLYTLFFYPFSEILKSCVYMTKFDIFKGYL